MPAIQGWMPLRNPAASPMVSAGTAALPPFLCWLPCLPQCQNYSKGVRRRSLHRSKFARASGPGPCWGPPLGPGGDLSWALAGPTPWPAAPALGPGEHKPRLSPDPTTCKPSGTPTDTQGRAPPEPTSTQGMAPPRKAWRAHVCRITALKECKYQNK